ncbi:MAG: rhodanese-like domain-containing protein [Kangiellaceae bacterium]
MVNHINILEAANLLQQKRAIAIDIRDAASFAQGHIEGAIRIDNDNFQSFIESANKDTAIIVCCYHGNASQPASLSISGLGFESYSLQGGMTEWCLTQPTIQSAN